MATTWDLVGPISPLVASGGDMVLALGLAFGILLPARLLWRQLTRPIERRAWRNQLARIDNGEKVRLRDRLTRRWLDRRLRFSWRSDENAAIAAAPPPLGPARRPAAHALLIALNPIWGFSWHFNTENWATEIWNRWAEARTDNWREAMVKAVHSPLPRRPIAGRTPLSRRAGGHRRRRRFQLHRHRRHGRRRRVAISA